MPGGYIGLPIGGVIIEDDIGWFRCLEDHPVVYNKKISVAALTGWLTGGVFIEETIGWFRPLDDPPIRWRAINVATLFAATVSKHLPTPDVLVTFSAIESNDDVFLSGISVYGVANTAIVSVEEVQANNDAAASIRE